MASRTDKPLSAPGRQSHADERPREAPQGGSGRWVLALVCQDTVRRAWRHGETVLDEQF